MTPDTLSAWFLDGICILGGGSGLTYYTWSVFEGWAANRWPVISGVVTSAKLEVKPSRIGHYYEPHVSYSYAIAGTTYKGELRRFGETEYSFRSSAESRLARYTVGKPVQVHYHPKDHELSVLELGLSPWTYLYVVGFAGILTFGIGLLIALVQ